MPNIARNCIINVGETVVYDASKDALIAQGMEDRTPCHFTAAVIAGFCATLLASPVDVIKTRYSVLQRVQDQKCQKQMAISWKRSNSDP